MNSITQTMPDGSERSIEWSNRHVGFYLKRDGITIQFTFMPRYDSGSGDIRLYPSDVGYHSPEPTREGETPFSESCPRTDGRACYYDGSSLQAEELGRRIVYEGMDVVWSELESRHDSVANDIKLITREAGRK